MKKIFISSTFRDMQAERDAIHTTVVPELRTMAQQYGEDMEVCDLRWGVNTGDLDSEEGSQKVLSVCLDEIDKCKPFMLVILGERYGWIPEPELLQSAASRKNYQLEEMEKSVTALEIEYGALDDSEVLKRSIFMFREPMPEADGDYQSEGEDYAKRLNALKKRIRKLTGERVFSYRLGWDNENRVPTELENFTQIVTEQLRALLEGEWQENAKLHENQKEEKRHWGFVDMKAGQFAGRAELLSECRQKLGTEKGKLLIVGEAGSGKSTLWSKLVSNYRAQGWNVYPFICGNTGRSTSAMDILKQWIFYVEGLLGVEHFEGEGKSEKEGEHSNSLQGMSERANKTEEDWKGRLRDVLAMYCAREDSPQLLLAADGLDQLNHDKLAENYGFLPIFSREKVHVLLSCLNDYKRKQYDGEEIVVNALTQQERIEILQGMLSYQRKGLDKAVIDEVMKKKGSDNPLYLSLLIQRLTMMDKDDFAVIAEYGNDMQAINRYQAELVRQAPDDTEEMACLLIQETGERVNKELVQRMADYIAVSRQGLRECDLQALLESEGIPWNSLDFSRTVHYMPMLFTERNNGQIDFTHRIIRSGLRSGLDEAEMMRKIFAYLKGLPGEDELRMNEIVYYCYVLDEKKYFVKYIEKAGATERQKAAHELYLLCMEDSGEWYAAVLQGNEDFKCGRAMTVFAEDHFDKAFVRDSMRELEIQLKIYDCTMQISRRLYEEQGTPRSARDYSISCICVGDIYDQQERFEEALEKYEESLAIRRKLYEEQGTPRSARDYSISCSKVGDIYEQQKRYEEALEKYGESLAISQKLYGEQGTPESARYYSFICRRIGKIYRWQGKIGETLEKYEESLVISRKLYEEQQTLESALDYSISCECIGSIYELQEGRLEEALEKYEESLAISRKLYAEQGTPESARNYSVSCRHVRTIYTKQGRYEEALEKYEEALAINRKLYAEQGTPGSARDYGFSYSDVEDIYKKQGRYEEALEKYEEEFTVYKKLYNEQQTLESARDFSLICYIAGSNYEEQGRFEDALKKYEEYLAVGRKLYNEQQTPENASDYSDRCNVVGWCYGHQGKLTEALEKFEEALAISWKLYNEQQTPKSASDYTISCNNIGAIFEEQGRLTEALEKYEESFAIFKKLYNEQKTLDSARDYSDSCKKIGSIYKMQGRLLRALEKYEEDCALNRKLYNEQQTRPMVGYVYEEQRRSARNYSDSCYNIGAIYEEQGRLTEALEKYEESFAIFKKLYNEQKTLDSARDYSDSCKKIGSIYKMQGRLLKALEKYEEDCALNRKLYNEQQTHSKVGYVYEEQRRSARNYSDSCYNVGAIYEEQGKLAEALEKYEKGLAVSRRLYEEQMTSQSEQDYKLLCSCVKKIQEKVSNKLISIFNLNYSRRYEQA